MGSQPNKVLIVEDDMIISMVIEKMIKKMSDALVQSVTTGRDAIKAAEEFSPDLILADIKLKDDIDGIEVINHIRKSSSVPVIYITGNSDAFSRNRAKKSGYVEYMTKPIQMTDLEAAIRKAVK